MIHGDEIVCCATRAGKALVCKIKDVNFLAGPGRGVKVINVAKGDRVLGYATTTFKTKGLLVVSTGGKRLEITPGKYRVTGRAGKGFPLTKRTGLAEVVIELPPIPNLPEKGNNGGNRKGKKK